MQKQIRASFAGLPYMNNPIIVLFVVVINLAAAFIFEFGRVIDTQNVLVDAGICGITTSVIDVLIVWYSIKRMRARGALPSAVPESAFMRRLPKKPAPLAIVFAVAFMTLMPAIAFVILWFFGITEFTFAQFVFWKIVYSAILCAKILELAVLRFVQPDCQSASDPAQTGEANIVNPLPRGDTFKNLFNTVTSDFGFNMVIGLATGGVVITNQYVAISPTTREGVVIAALALGIIISFRMVLPVAGQISALVGQGAIPLAPKRQAWIAWLPEKPMGFALALMPLVMALSAVVMSAVFAFFGFASLNFFQYFIIRTIFSTLLSKLVVILAILRYRQPPKNVKGNAARASV